MVHNWNNGKPNFSYEVHANLGVNLNRQKNSPLDISCEFSSKTDMVFYVTEGRFPVDGAGVSDYVKGINKYPYLGQIIALVSTDPEDVHIYFVKTSDWDSGLTTVDAMFDHYFKEVGMEIADATQTTHGLMSAADKVKLDGVEAGANNYTLPEASSTLGGVKSGGDVTISSGLITVNDNSHDHIMSNITGLSDALAGKQNVMTEGTDYLSPNSIAAAYIAQTSKGVANGVASLDGTGRVPSSQLPSYVDDVIEGYYYNGKFYQDSAHTIEIIGESGKIYVDLHENKTYRWSGTKFTEISASLALGETSTTAYRGDRGKTAYEHSQIVTGNPHNVTFSQLGTTTTETELGYVHGVTSSIQTQINSTNSAITTHTGNSAIHVAAGEKDTWNAKQNALVYTKTSGNRIKAIDGVALSAEYDGDNKISETYATISGLSSHTSNSGIHVTSSEKSTWNNKQDAITFGGTADYISLINTKPLAATYDDSGNDISTTYATVTGLAAHIEDTEVHVTSSEKSTWNAKADPSSIPSGSSTLPSMDGTASYGTGTTWARADHVHPVDTSRQAVITDANKLSADYVSETTSKKFITSSERTSWNSKVSVSVSGHKAVFTSS